MMPSMQVVLHHPKREARIKGPLTVERLLKELNLLPEAVLVIRGNDCFVCLKPTFRQGECRP